MNRFIAAVAHITDFPLEVSEYTPNGIYCYKGVTLVADDNGFITVHRGPELIYQLRVYGGKSIYHNTLRASIYLDERNNKWVTRKGDRDGMSFTNLYDAMKHCGGTNGWI